MASAYISIVFASVFLTILFILHFLKQELDPGWRMVSEYEIGRFGWMMRLAFPCTHALRGHSLRTLPRPGIIETAGALPNGGARRGFIAAMP